MKLIILDLDNCICDDGWRIDEIEWDKPAGDARYEKYHALHPFDVAGNRQIYSPHVANARFIVITGRPWIHRATTLRWLALEDIYGPLLQMRPPGNQSTLAMKEKALKQTLDQPGLVQAVGGRKRIQAFDDRQDIVDMYRSYGLDAHRVFIHEKDAYAKPT